MKDAPNILARDKRLRDIVQRVLSVSVPDRIMLFGSRARGDYRSRSDFDLALFGRVDLGKVHERLEEADTLLGIDVISFDEVDDERLKNKILEEGVVIYERKV